jgi:type II secretion system protein D
MVEMKKTRNPNAPAATAQPAHRPGRLTQAFLTFLAGCCPTLSWAQEGQSTARFAPLTPSVFRTTTGQGTPVNSLPVAQNSVSHRLQWVASDQMTRLLANGLGRHLQGRQEATTAVIDLPVNPQTGHVCQMRLDLTQHTVQVTGPGPAVAGWLSVIQLLDSPQTEAGQRGFSFVPATQQAEVVQKLSASAGLRPTADRHVYQIQLAAAAGSAPGRTRTAGWQDETLPSGANSQDTGGQDTGGQDTGGQDTGGQGNGGQDDFQVPGTSLQISVDPNTGALIVQGTADDIRKFQDLLSQLGEQAMQTRPQTTVIPLENSNSQALGAVIQQLYNDVFATRFGTATVTPINEPNALVVSGTPQAMEELKAIIKQLDIESDDVRGSFVVFRLQHIAATNAANRLSSFFRSTASLPGTTQGGGGFQGAGQTQPVLIIPDPRSNLIIMKGGSTELRQAKELLDEIDIVDGEHIKTQEVRIVQLRNSVATDMAQVIFAAINGGVLGATPVGGSPAQGGLGGFGAQQFNQQPNQDPAVANTALRLKLMSINQETGVISSGILFDVKIVADASSNSLVITGPSESLPLVEKLIRELDRLPDAETQLKVFTIINGDAQQLFDMLNQLFTPQQQQGGGLGGFGAQNDGLTRLPLRSGSSDQTLVNLRFALELRTNTIIAAGSAGDLQVVEDLLTTLDRSNGDRFIKKVFRLSNAPAEDTAVTLTNTYNAEQEALQQDPTTQAAIVNVRRRVIIQPDAIQNHLIVIATPETMVEIEGMITALDRRPNMVAIQVMIAEVSLNQTEEFGIEFGVQDSIVFDRGLAGTNIIGYPFNQAGLGNSLNATGLAGRENLAGQGLMNFGLGRVNAGLGYGGLVLSAGNESINILLRALKDQGRLQVLSRPHLMTIDNLNARVQVGQRVPYFSGSFINQLGGVQNQVTLEDVGIILEVVPRVGPDGLITMLVNVTNSNIGSEAEGTVVAVDPQGNAIRQAPINITESITTAIARSEQTVVLGGLLRTSKSYFKRGIPILSDLPRVGALFSYQNEREVRSELLIFLTPTIKHSHEDMAMYNQVEMDRLNWCFQDVIDLHGPIGNIYQGTFADGSGPEEVYPELRSPGIPQYQLPDGGYPIDAEDCPPVEYAPGFSTGAGPAAPPTTEPPGNVPANLSDRGVEPGSRAAQGLTPLWRK